MKQPFMKLYVRDWRADPALRASSIAARGLWLELCTFMHEAEPVGHLVIGEDRLGLTDVALIASYCGIPDVALVADLLEELRRRKVLSLADDGTIVSRYLVRKGAESEAAQQNGRRGGNPSLRQRRSITQGVNPSDKVGDILAGATLEARRLEARYDGVAAAREGAREGDQEPEREPVVDRSKSPALELCTEFVAIAVQVGAIDDPPDRKLAAYREDTSAAAQLLREHGRDEVLRRAQRLCEAHVTPGPNRMVAPPSIARLARFWSSSWATGEPRVAAGGYGGSYAPVQHVKAPWREIREDGSTWYHFENESEPPMMVEPPDPRFMAVPA